MKNNEGEVANSSFEINTYEIYWQLRDKWNNGEIRFPREYYEEINEAFAFTFKERKLQSHVNWEIEVSALYDYLLYRYPLHERNAKQVDNFPIPNYIVLHKKAGFVDSDFIFYVKEMYKENITDFLSPFTILILDEDKCAIDNTDINFPLFFSLQLALIDVMEIDGFLNYQLEYNFNNDIAGYIWFLEKITIKYDKYFKGGLKTLVQTYSNLKKQLANKVDNTTDDKVSLRRKVLALYYLFKELGIENTSDKTKRAEFIKLVTGKEQGQKTVNGNIYQYLKNPFPASDKALKEDLQYIRKYFEDLELHNIVKKINEEINLR